MIHIALLFSGLFVLGSVGYATGDHFIWLYHDILKWHIPRHNSIITDGDTFYDVCKHCGEVIQQSENGTWF